MPYFAITREVFLFFYNDVLNKAVQSYTFSAN